MKMRIPGQTVSLIMYFVSNFSFAFQLYERYFIDRSKTLNFILIPGIVCQLADFNYGHPCKILHIKRSIFTLK